MVINRFKSEINKSIKISVYTDLQQKPFLIKNIYLTFRQLQAEENMAVTSINEKCQHKHKHNMTIHYYGCHNNVYND